jgi:hypothetical protein
VPSSSSLQISFRKHQLKKEPGDVLDAEQSVVLGDTLASCRGASLDLTDAEGDGEVSDDSALSLTTAVRNHHTPAIRL